VSPTPSYESAQRTATAFLFEIALLRIKKTHPVAVRNNLDALILYNWMRSAVLIVSMTQCYDNVTWGTL